MKKVFVITILVLTLLISSVTGLMIYLHMKEETAKFQDEIEITLDGTAQEKLQVRALDLIPGATRECKVVLQGTEIGTYRIVLDFDEVEKGTLKNYVNVEIEVGETKLVKPLSQLLAEDVEEVFDFTVPFDGTTTLIIRYAMPIDVTDEAQGATTAFDVLLNVSFIA